jgi:uncharacterized membrane protein YfcA
MSLSLLLVGGAAFAAGVVNAIAGGGSLITFPVLVAVGLPHVVASLTNTVALCPGYFGATIAQRKDLEGQRGRMLRVLPWGALGGVVGALLLLFTDERAFEVVVPFLILFAAALLAFQDRLRGWLMARTKHGAEGWAVLPVALGAVYGGYFGAGLGVIVLAALAVVLADSLTRINALKQSVSLAVNVAAAGVFLVSGRVDWPIAGVMLVCSLAGGALGGMIASKIPASVLRWLVVTVAVVVAIVYFVQW